MSRSTSLYIQNNPLPSKELKERFDIDYVIEGNIKPKDGTFEIATRLFKTDKEELILNTKLSFELENWTTSLTPLVKEISDSVGESKMLNYPKSDEQNKARELYLRGLYHWHRYRYEEMLLAINFFKKSIKENKDYALPYAAIADCYSIIGIMGFDRPKEVFQTAKEHVNKAIVLNDKRSESYVSAAFISMFYTRDFKKAKINLEQAIKLNKDSVKAHHALAMYYIHKKELDKAEKHSLITIKLDSLALPHYAMMIRISIYKKNFEQAMDYINVALNIEENSLPFLLELRGFVEVITGKIESAIEDFTFCLDKVNADPLYYANLAYAYSKSNFYNESRELEQQLEKLKSPKDTGTYDYAKALIKLGRADYSSFFSHMKKAVNSNLGMLPGELMCNPLFSEVRKDERYIELLKLCGLIESNDIVFKQRRPTSAVNITTNTSEILSFDPQDLSFIEGSDNYSTVYWHDEGVLKNKMLRITLKSLEEQLSDFDYIIRCHKSFIINLNEELSITGNAKAYFLESSYLPKRIPISRTKSDLVKNFIQNK